MRRLLTLLFITLAGCSGATYQLDCRWSPLVQIREGEIAATDSGMVLTRDDAMHVFSLSAFFADYPIGSDRFEGLLRHERFHAVRQHQALTVSWLNFHYWVSPSFRWQEEQACWTREIDYLVRRGYGLNVDYLAKILSGPRYYGMVSYDDAVTWLNTTWAHAATLPPLPPPQ